MASAETGIGMDRPLYYKSVRDRLQNGFQFSDSGVASGRELVNEGAPAFSPAMAEPLALNPPKVVVSVTAQAKRAAAVHGTDGWA